MLFFLMFYLEMKANVRKIRSFLVKSHLDRRMPFFAAIPHSLRTLLRAPAFTATVALVLTLAIAINTTIFTVVDQVLLKPFPYEAPHQLMMIWESNPALGGISADRLPATSLNLDAWRAQNHSFQAIEAFQMHLGYNLTGIKNPEHLTAARATPGLFQMLGIHAAVGRTFLAGDDAPGANPIAIATHTFAEKHFRQENPIGRTLLLDDVPYTVVGVLPKDFHLPGLYQGIAEYKPDIWLPLPTISVTDPPQLAKRHRLIVCGRLIPGTSLSQARNDMKSIADRLAKESPDLNRGYSVNVFPLDVENTDPDLRNELRVLLLAALLVLVLACTNLAGLMLVRTTARRKIIAIMAALGANRWALIVPILSESLLLALIAGVLAHFLSYACVHLIGVLKPNDIHAPERLTMNLTGFVFNACISMFTTLIFGLIPAWLVAHSNLSDALKSSSTGPSRRSVGRTVLVSGQVAAALTLAITAMLLTRSFQRLLQVDPGFRTQQLLTAHLVLPQKRYSDSIDRVRFCQQLRDKLRSLPGVKSAALIDNMPLYAIQYSAFEVEGRASAIRSAAPTADHARVTPNFFQTMDVQLHQGRLFTDQDAEADPAGVAIINETVARQLWPSQNPIGSHIRELPFNEPPGPWRTVVGVVSDFRQFNIETPARPEIFWPAKDLISMTVVLRTTAADPLALSSSLQQAIWAVDRDLPLSDLQTMDQMIRDFASQRQFNMLVLTGFSSFSVLLALVGLYGLISAFVSDHIHDIGIRLALGAQRMQVCLALIVRGLPAVGAGITLGLMLSYAAKGLIANILFQVNPLDLQIYIVVPIVFLAILVLTSIIATIRAARVDPAKVLRSE
jgi:predicted permease